MDKNLNFGKFGQNTVLPQRPISPHRIPSDISFEFEKSEGVRPSVAYMPHRYAPTIKVIQTKSGEKVGIAIPKGTIVSAIPVLNDNSYAAGYPGNATVANSSGEHALGINIKGDVMLASVDQPLSGYGKVQNAAVIANGGTDVADQYNQYDVETARVKLDGSLITTDDYFLRRANIPVGVAQEDIYINREGQYLNASESSFMLFDALLSDWLVAVPFVVNGGTNSGAVTASVSTFAGTTLASAVTAGATSIDVADATGIDVGYKIELNNGAGTSEVVTVSAVAGNTLTISATANAYNAGDAVNPSDPVYGQKVMSPGYAAIYNNGITCLIANSANDIMTLGNYVASNIDGKYVPQFDAASSLTAQPTAQTVGKIISVDNKITKDIEDTVQTYPYNHAGGTSTYGIPMDLYRLMAAVMSANGVPVDYDHLADGINRLDFGYVWINLHVN